MKEFNKSAKLEHVAYDIRGPVLEEADRMIANGEKILRLNTGNPAAFGLTAPDEVIRDLIMNARESEGYSDSKGIFSARKAIMQYCQLKNIPDVDVDDISSLDILPNLERGGQSENQQTADNPPEQAEPAPFSEIPKPEKKRKCFVKPNIPEIASYCNERKNGVDPVAFYNFYESKDWYVGKNKMKNWRACVHTWEQRQQDFKKQHPPFTQNDFSQQDFSESSIPEALRSKQKIEIDIGEALESVMF